MKKFLVTLFVMTLVVGVTGMAYAYSGSGSWHIEDNYWGANDNGWKDVIGDSSKFGIASMDVTIAGTEMTVRVNTPFKADTYFENFIDYGDLFISTNGWSPFGTAPYPLDNASKGETWEYAFDVSKQALYDITNATITTSDDVLGGSGLTYRNGQEVLANTDNLTQIGLGSFKRDAIAGYVEMKFDISALTYQPGVQWGLRWEMTCANDVIEGSFDPVPEPSTVFLLGAGLLGLAAFGRKHFNQK